MEDCYDIFLISKLEASQAKQAMAPTPLVMLQRLLEEPQHLLMIVLTIFFLAILSSVSLSRTWSKKTNLPPSPPKFPFIGNFYQMGDLLHHSFRDLSRKDGPICTLATPQFS
ncbi:hypothetical protein Syun_030406 [Stephania yunnanensis]|uniref:Cytochrome P450 n=1 Tax=Stephania yunnanensis TaxID=152371 RepID=A0AAP0EAQ9_9MAGN